MAYTYEDVKKLGVNQIIKTLSPTPYYYQILPYLAGEGKGIKPGKFEENMRVVYNTFLDFKNKIPPKCK